MRWCVTKLGNFIYFLWGILFGLRVLGFFNSFLYQQASCLDRKFLQAPQGTSGFVWVVSKWRIAVIDICTAVAHLLPSSLPLPHYFSLCSPPPPCLFLLCGHSAVGSHNAWHSPWFVFQVLLFPPCEAQRFPMSAVISGLPFRKAKAAEEILSRPVGKCSPAIAINTVPFPVLLKGTPNRKVSALCTALQLRFNSLAPTSLSCPIKAPLAFFAKCSLSLGVIASRGLPLRVFTTAFFPLLPREMLVVLDSEIIDIDLSIWKYIFSVTMVNKSALKDDINMLAWLTSEWLCSVRGFTFLERSLLCSLRLCFPSAYVFDINCILHMHCKEIMGLLIALWQSLSSHIIFDIG